MQYALVSSTCKTTHRNMTLAVERNVKTNKSKSEVVACMLRNSVSVNGISVNISIKLFQFADHMTLFLADVYSLTESLKISYYR